MILNSLTLVYPNISDRYMEAKERFQKENSPHRLKEIETLRDNATQLKYYEQGRSEEGKVITNSVPGRSWHQYGLAIDFAFTGEDPYLEKKMDKKAASLLWRKVGNYMKSTHLIWGGDFLHADLDHVEDHYGMNLDEACKLMQAGGLIAVWNEIDVIRKSRSIL